MKYRPEQEAKIRALRKRCAAGYAWDAFKSERGKLGIHTREANKARQRMENHLETFESMSKDLTANDLFTEDEIMTAQWLWRMRVQG